MIGQSLQDWSRHSPRRRYLDLANKFQNPVFAFVALGLLFGVLFCFITPPFEVLDETMHFSHAYHLSSSHIHAERLSDTLYGGYMSEVTYDSMLAGLQFRNSQPQSRTSLMDNFRTRASNAKPGVKVQAVFNSVAVYPPVAYVPQAVGILEGRILRIGSATYLLYLARLSNLIVWVMLVAMAVRLIPFGKWALVVVTLLPTTIFQAASASADTPTMGLAFLAAAYVFKLATEKKILVTRQYAFLAILMLLLSLTKPAYMCFVLLVFALPRAKFKTRQSYWLGTLGLVALCLIFVVGWNLTVRNIDIMLPILPNHPPINVDAQLHHILTHPWSFGHAVWNSYLTGRADILVTTFVAQFGVFYDLHLPFVILILAYAVLLVAFLYDEKVTGFKMPRRLRAISGLTLLGTFAAITGILYLTWNVTGNNFVDGLQARYFVPLTILLIPLTKLGKSKLLRVQAQPVLLLVGSTTILIVSVLMMLHRFYYTV